MGSQHFLQAVLSYIRSKEAKQAVHLELSQHLQHAKKAWLAKGYTEKKAEAKAVEEMGNPATLGRSFNQLYKPKVDWLLWALFGSILLVGFLPLLSLQEEQFAPLVVASLVQNKGIQSVLGILLAVAVMFLDFRKWARFGYLFYGIGLGILLLLLFFNNGHINGEAVLNVFHFTVHVWYVLPFFCLAWAALFSKETLPLVGTLMLAILPMLFIAMIPNLSVLFIYSSLVLVLFLCSPYSVKQKCYTVGGLLLVILGLITWTVFLYQAGKIAPYQVARIAAFLDPTSYQSTEGYIPYTLIQIREHAQWFGASTSTHLPEPMTHLVLAHIIQSFGLAAAFAIVGLLLLVVWRLLHITQTIRIPFGRLVVTGALTVFATQLLYVTAMTFGFVPITSFSLPFISYGLTPTILNALWIGLALSMYRYGRFKTSL